MQLLMDTRTIVEQLAQDGSYRRFVMSDGFVAKGYIAAYDRHGFFTLHHDSNIYNLAHVVRICDRTEDETA